MDPRQSISVWSKGFPHGGLLTGVYWDPKDLAVAMRWSDGQRARVQLAGGLRSLVTDARRTAAKDAEARRVIQDSGVVYKATIYPAIHSVSSGNHMSAKYSSDSGVLRLEFEPRTFQRTEVCILVPDAWKSAIADVGQLGAPSAAAVPPPDAVSVSV